MKITVVIPTIAGRSMYLASALKTCVSQDEDFEILVSDNSEGDAREVVESFSDRRLSYVSPPSYLPMAAHWDFALTQVTGDVLCLIGDDDALMPGCIREVKAILSKIGNIPIHHALANYRWPDFIDASSRDTVEFMHCVGSRSRMVDSDEYLFRVAEARARYIDGPMVYHNFVPMGLVQQLSHGGRFFRRANPDIYSSLAIAANAPRFFSTDRLLTMAGQGARANGATVKSGEGADFLVEMQRGYEPRFAGRTVQIHLLDSLIEVAEHFGRQDVLGRIRYGAHVAGAISEARHLGRAVRSKEMRAALALARDKGALGQTAAALAARAIRKLGRSLGPDRPSPDCLYERGQVIGVGVEVSNVFDAANLVGIAIGARQPQ